jgi:ATP-dependent DNA helicase PIF1
MGPHLGITDHWYRYEWQARGTGHVHAVIWMKDAPKMGAKTVEQREAFAVYWNKKVTAFVPFLGQQPDPRNECSLPFISIANTQRQFTALMNRVQGHLICTKGGCLRKAKNADGVCEECRFFMPRDLLEEGCVTKAVNKKSWMYAPKRNHPRINQVIPIMLMGWLANTDAQPMATVGGLVKYVAKYVSKHEKKSVSFAELQAQVRILILCCFCVGASPIWAELANLRTCG